MSQPSGIASKPLGDAFELEVASHYEALGYEVEHDLDINGQQVDLLITRQLPGLGQVSYIVECRYKSHGVVGNQEVADFANVLSELQRQNQVHGGIMVSSRGFSRPAKRRAQLNPSLFLTTARALSEEKILRSEPARLRAEYESSPICNLYIHQEGFGRLPGNASDSHYSDLLVSLFRWCLTKSSTGACFILGDYGTGKTTLLERLRYLLIIEKLTETTAPLPVIFYLKNFYKFDTLAKYVGHSFNENYSASINADWFWNECERGNFVLLLDGFDEISIETNEQIRTLLITRVSPLLSTKSKAIISCRPSYFVTAEEFARIIQSQHDVFMGPYSKLTSSRSIAASIEDDDAQRLRSKITNRFVELAREKPTQASRYVSIQIFGFSEEQIREYLNRFQSKFRDTIGADAETVLRFLKSVYDLSDLMRRLILLDMVVETILIGTLDVHNSRLRIGPSRIYDIYVDGKLTMEASKGFTRHLLSQSERKEFSQVVAFAMFKTNKLDITFRELLKIVSDYGDISHNLQASLKSYEDVEKVANDVALCGFLEREGDVFRFSHRSFMEFFVARKIFLELRRNGESELLSQGTIPREVLYFLESLIRHDDPVFGALLKGVQTAIPDRGAERGDVSGAVRALVCSERCIHKLEGDRLKIGDVGVRALQLSELGVRSIEMVGVEAEEVSIARSRVPEIEIEDSELGGLDIRASELGIQRADRALRNVRIKESSIEFHCSVQLSGIYVEDGKLDVHRGISLEQAELHRCTINLVDTLGSGERNTFLSRHAKFLGCHLRQGSLRNVMWRIDAMNSFVDCVFDCVYVSGAGLVLAMEERAAKKKDVMKNCRGMIITRNQGELVDPDKGAANLLRQFETRRLKQQEATVAEAMLRRNVIRPLDSDVIIINATYLRHYKRYREMLSRQYDVGNVDGILALIS